MERTVLHRLVANRRLIASPPAAVTLDRVLCRQRCRSKRSEIFFDARIAEIARSNVYSQDDRSLRTGRAGQSCRPGLAQAARSGCCDRTTPLPDEGNRFLGLAAGLR